MQRNNVKVVNQPARLKKVKVLKLIKKVRKF